MSKFDAYELTHPELLSEHQLCIILKNTCIEALNFDKLCKSDLLKLYKRVALPLPRRQDDKAKDLNAEANIISERSVTSVRDNDTSNSTTDVNIGSKRRSSHPQADRMRCSNNNQNSTKKIRLCSASNVEIACNGVVKRRCDEWNEELSVNKRQKITWP